MNSTEPFVQDLPDADVSPSLDAELRSLLVLCFPKDQALFSRHRHYKEPPAHRWIIRDSSGRLIAHACIHDKMLGSSEGDIHIGGVAEVCVHPNARGQGLVRLLLHHIQQWLATHNFEFSVLFGDANVYSSSGYVSIPNPIQYYEPATQQWLTTPIASAMILPLSARKWPTGQIDLRGPRF